MKTIQQMITDKQHGIDCTEEESAELKGFIKEEKKNVFPLYNSLLDIIANMFPQEYMEAIDEMNANK